MPDFNLKKLIRKTPFVGPLAQRIHRRWLRPREDFAGSEQYWIDRYESGGNSGDGSYGRLARFKADVLNAFVREHEIRSVIEYGCGDGHQLTLAQYPAYTGFDVSPQALHRCRELFDGDPTKTFAPAGDYGGERAELTLSLDVIFHLVEDEVFEQYMHRLFDSSDRFVIVYSSDQPDEESLASHVRHRAFSPWIAEHKPQWTLREHIPNMYPFRGDTLSGTKADFFFYERR